MRRSERFLEIARPLALLHYGRIIGHKPGYHPVRAIPTHNHFTFRNRLRLHAGLVPKLTDGWSDRRDRADNHFRKSCWPTDAFLALPLSRMDPPSTVIAVSGIDCRLQSGRRGN